VTYQKREKSDGEPAFKPPERAKAGIPIEDETLKKFANENAIKWLITPAEMPHFNGLAEAGVKLAKRQIRKGVGKQILSYDQFKTTMVRVEGFMNMRPTETKLRAEHTVIITPALIVVGNIF
jgi:hypothetical protein